MRPYICLKNKNSFKEDHLHLFNIHNGDENGKDGREEQGVLGDTDGKGLKLFS
jgi:hypothetical protein